MSKMRNATDETPRTRLERDPLGAREVPADAYWGAHAQRAMENFPLARRPMRRELVRALAQVKKACARTNLDLGYLPRATALAVMAACDELAGGELADQVRVDALQGGAGTSANMAVNEIVANRAEELLGGRRGEYALVHPLRCVNLHQSTNDVFPTAIKVAAIRLLRELGEALAALQAAFQAKEEQFASVVKLGRTQLRDAVPMTLGAGMSAYAEALARDRWRVSKCEERLRTVNLGGVAVGTGLTAPRRYIYRVVDVLREETGLLGLARAENLVDATQNADCFVEVSGILKAHAVNLFKISSDLRLLSSGPTAGLGEIVLPAVQAGSSVMPGKVNPVICEAVGQAAVKAMGADFVVTQAAQLGQLELNAFLPLLADSLLESLALLRDACRIFRDKCVLGLEADAAVCRRHVERSLSTVTALVPWLGYDAAGEAAREAERRGTGVLEVVLEAGLMTREELERALSPEAMAVLGSPDVSGRDGRP